MSAPWWRPWRCSNPGTTSVVDHFSERPSLTTEGLRSAADAFDNLGMRANIATMFADRGFLDTIPLLPGELPDEVRDRPSGRAQSPEEYIAVVEQAYLDARERDGRVRVILGTDGPQRCSDHLLELTGELERKYEMGWQTHALEAKTQAVFAREQYGVGLIEHMRDMGLLNSRLSLVHAVWLSEREMELCAEYGVNIVHCPGSNLHLGSGIAPVGRYRELGVNVALGSDGGNCGGVAMPEQLRLAARLSRVTEPDYARWLTAADALKMDYSGGKRVLMRGSCGAIAEGADADLVLLDADNCLWQPGGRSHLPAGVRRERRERGHRVCRRAQGAAGRAEHARGRGGALCRGARVRRAHKARQRAEIRGGGAADALPARHVSERNREGLAGGRLVYRK